MSETVWVLTIGHRHGHDTFVSKTEDGAEGILAAYVRDWWVELIERHEYAELPDEPPTSNAEAIETYFGTVDDEYYSLDECAVLP